MIQKVLVPVDFSEVTLQAVNQARVIAKLSNAELILLHVCELSKKSEKEIELSKIASKITFEYQISVQPIITNGNIFDDIAQTADDQRVDLIVMGTHGLNGLQLFTGSYALKVVAGSTKPFIVTQANTKLQNGFKTIILPVLGFRPTEETLEVLINLVKINSSKVWLAAPKGSTENQKKDIKTSLFLFKRIFEIEDIDYRIQEELSNQSNFETRLMQLASKISADLIAAVNLQELGYFSLPGSSFEQHLITNNLQIPVLILNPKE
jgi:nucleotide-binding universal stress UspA family protein